MATEETSGMGIAVGVILTLIVIGAIALFVIFGLPMMQQNQAPKANSLDVNLTLPANSNETPSTGNDAVQ